MKSGVERRLAALLSADVKGYSRLMGEDEVATVQTLTAYREVMSALVGRHRGRVVDFTGDNLLAEFASVVDAVQCAVEIQQTLRERNAALPPSRRMEFRIGINLGDVIVEGERIYGDGVNIAARMEALADAGGVCLSGTAHDHVEGKLPLQYESLGAHSVKNIVKPVQVYRVLTGVETPGRASAPPPAIPERPDHRLSIAVLPFTNLSGDPGQEHLADGMTEELITTLSKVSAMLVIASNSVFTYKGRPVNVQEVARELGVRHVLEGSIRRAGDRVRITAQLIDGITGYHLWAERYERQLTDIFAVQDDITRRIVTELAVTLTEGEQARIRTRGIKSFEAWELASQGLTRFRELTRDGNTQARELFERAARLEGPSTALYVALGWTHVQDARLGWSAEPRISLGRAEELARAAIRLDEATPDAHALLGSVHLLARRLDEAAAAAERAVALGPGISELKVILAHTLTYVGRPDEAIGLVRQAIRESPRFPAWYEMVLGRAYRLTGRYEEALTAHEAHCAREPHTWAPHIGLAIVYMLLGREQDARDAVARLRAVDPHFTLERFADASPYRDPADLEREMDALRRAGLP